MIHVTLMDGSRLEVPQEDALELLPYRHVLTSPVLRSPAKGLIYHRGEVLPILGPLPDAGLLEEKCVDERPWLLLLRKGYAQVVRGLPEFLETEEAKRPSADTAAGQEKAA